jgi:putative transposase
LAFCGGKDAWRGLVPILDSRTRQVPGREPSPTARAKTAGRALESALLGRFGLVCGAPSGPTIRHGNGPVFGSRLHRRTAAEYGLQQEFITPCTPEQNGLAERSIRSFKEERAWRRQFESLEEARGHIGAWIVWCNSERPHQARGYKIGRAHV